MPRVFCKRLGTSPPVKGQVSCFTLEHSGNQWIFRLTGQLALLPYSFADYQEMQLHQCSDLTVLRASGTGRRCLPRYNESTSRSSI